MEESIAFHKSLSENKNIKATKQLAEGIFFMTAGGLYVTFTLTMLLYPQNKISYLVIIVSTIVIVIIYYMRIYGIPVPFTDHIVITDFSTDWRDVITKICQQIMVVPVTALLILRKSL